MHRFNLITNENSVEPKYDVHNREPYYCICVSPQEEVCIKEVADANYLSWCSLTNVSDQSTNAAIFNYLLNSSERKYANEFYVLGSRYYEVRHWHRFIVRKEFYEDEKQYRSPVSGLFFGGDPQHNKGLFLANEIQQFVRQELNKCHFRLMDDTYRDILQRYKIILMKETSPEYYYQMKPIMAILESESYLKLCPNEEVRHLYLECLQQCSNLYNAYMSASR